MEKLLSVKEVSRIFCINRQTVRNWIKADKIKAVKLGKMYFIKEEDLFKVFNTSEGEKDV